MSSNEVILEYRDITITRADIDTLAPYSCVGDMIISIQMHILSDKYAELVKQQKCFFMTACTSQFFQTFPIEMVKESLVSLNLEKIEYVFLPISDVDPMRRAASHWSLLYAHNLADSLTIFHFDSMNQYNGSVARQLAKKFAALIGKEQFEYLALPCPTQPNSYDCGVYVMAYCDLFVESNFNHESASSKLNGEFAARYRRSLRLHIEELAKNRTECA